MNWCCWAWKNSSSSEWCVRCAVNTKTVNSDMILIKGARVERPNRSECISSFNFSFSNYATECHGYHSVSIDNIYGEWMQQQRQRQRWRVCNVISENEVTTNRNGPASSNFSSRTIDDDANGSWEMCVCVIDDTIPSLALVCPEPVCPASLVIRIEINYTVVGERMMMDRECCKVLTHFSLDSVGVIFLARPVWRRLICFEHSNAIQDI